MVICLKRPMSKKLEIENIQICKKRKSEQKVKITKHGNFVVLFENMLICKKPNIIEKVDFLKHDNLDENGIIEKV